MTRKATFATAILALFAAPGDGVAQDHGDLSRADRVVVHSPHFDQPPTPRGGLNCDGVPPQFFGAENEAFDPNPSLEIRVGPQARLIERRNLAVRGVDEVPIPTRFDQALVFIEPFQAGSALPTDTLLTDSAGVARFSGPAGLYKVRPSYIGYATGTGVIRVRANRSDTLTILLDERAVCMELVQPN